MNCIFAICNQFSKYIGPIYIENHRVFKTVTLSFTFMEFTLVVISLWLVFSEYFLTRGHPNMLRVSIAPQPGSACDLASSFPPPTPHTLEYINLLFYMHTNLNKTVTCIIYENAIKSAVMPFPCFFYRNSL